MNENEESNILGNSGNDSIKKVGGDSIKTKSIPPTPAPPLKKVCLFLKAEISQVKIDPLFPQRLKKTEEGTKF